MEVLLLCMNAHGQSNLKHVDFPYGIDDAQLSALITACPHLSSLTSIKLCSRHLTNAALTIVAATWPHLSSLDIAECTQITDAGLRELTALPIVSLNVSECPRITSSGVKEFTLLHDVTSLSISQCDWLSHLELEEILSNCPHLLFLDLSFSSLTHLQGLGCCPQLGSLNLTGCEGLSVAELIQGIAPCHSLTSVNLSEWRHLTDSGLNELVNARPNLATVILSYCTGITNTGVRELDRLGQLQSLNLAGCSQVTDTGLNGLCQGACPHLAFIDLSEGYYISQQPPKFSLYQLSQLGSAHPKTHILM
jgi:F-box/leucine-rich repeat protein 2/20